MQPHEEVSGRSSATRMRLWCVTISYLGYLVWPLLAILAAIGLDLFDHAWEVAFLFSGFIPLLLLPVQLIFQFNDNIFAAFVPVVWMLVWGVATALFLRRPRGWPAIWIYFAIVSCFSFVQSFLGLFMLVGKSV